MRAVRALLAALALLFPTAGCEDDSELPDDAVYCLVPAHCANVSIEGAECCSGICVDCFTDSDSIALFVNILAPPWKSRLSPADNAFRCGS